MKPADDIRKIFRESTLSTNRDRHEAIFEKVRCAQEQSKTTEPAVSRYNIWNNIMKNPITKLAAAIIVIASLTTFFIFEKTSGVAFAIEQSIEAVSKYKAILTEGLDSERMWKENGSLEQKPYKSWAVANEDQTMVEKYRHVFNGIPIITTNGQKTWRYDPNSNTVHIENRGYVASECWFGSEFLEQLKAAHNAGILTEWKVKYGKDPSTGRERAYLTFSIPEGPPSPRSMWIEFDVENKLPISLKQWENPNWEGPAQFVVEKITYYESLPDELFEFEIPEGATVIEE